jgi:hypothetical protein
MMNKKLVALLLAVSAAANVAAYCDRDGYCDGVVEGTVDVADDAGGVAVDAADETVGVATDIADVGTLGIFGGRERREDRRNRRENRREDRRARRAARRGY